MLLDAIVVGGSYAGISAALQLALARRRIAVVDSGLRRNRFAGTSHGFLGQDGRGPGAIIEEAKAQLLAYANVSWLHEAATSAERQDDHFALTTQSGSLACRRLVLATGVADILPAVERSATWPLRWATVRWREPPRTDR
jgi:thioredoxin reductase